MSINYEKIEKLTIIGLENGVTVTAMFNPKELGVNKSVPWTKHKDSKSDQPSVEFSSAEGRSMDFELMFDRGEEAPHARQGAVGERQAAGLRGRHRVDRHQVHDVPPRRDALPRHLQREGQGSEPRVLQEGRVIPWRIAPQP